MTTRVDTAQQLPDLTQNAVGKLPEGARTYLVDLDRQLHFILREIALRNWALETTLGIAPSRPGNITGPKLYAAAGSAAAPSISFAADTDSGFYDDASDNQVRLALAGALAMIFNPNFLYIVSDTGFVGFGATADIKVARLDANTIQVADPSNNLRDLKARNVTSSGTGSYVQLPTMTVAQLPAATAGRTAFVTDAATTFILGLGLTVAGGGTNKVPVYADGTNWIIG